MPGFGPPGSAPLASGPQPRARFAPRFVLRAATAVTTALSRGGVVARSLPAPGVAGVALRATAVVARSLAGITEVTARVVRAAVAAAALAAAVAVTTVVRRSVTGRGGVDGE